MIGHTFLNAHFTDNERSTVRVFWVDDDTSDICEAMVEVNESDSQWKQLLEHTTINELHENTYKYIQDSQRAIKDQVVSIAREEGWIYEVNTENSRAAVKALLNTMFSEFDPDEGKEDLFFLKLEVFDLAFVRENKDRKAKAEIRKAATPSKVLELVCNMYHATQAEAS